jgi:ferrochelatase
MATKAILLANLGSPDSFSNKDVRKYLNDFLMDERVIDISFWKRILLVKGVIVPFRTSKSAAKYKTIWTENGSPLIYISGLVKEKLSKLTRLPVELCMRYGNPTPSFALSKLHNDNPNLKEVVLVPLYPHYAMSSFETAIEHVKHAVAIGNYSFTLKVVSPFFDHPSYIDSLANSIQPFLEKEFDHILFSYHGIPERHILKTDFTKSHCLKINDCCCQSSSVHEVCYRHQVITTTNLAAKKLALPEDKFSYSFQSRLGSDPWLQPYTSEQLKKFPGQGIRKLVIVSPAFVSDCLETLEEIRVEGMTDFLKSGGEEFTPIPCLNDRDDWIKTLAELAKSKAIELKG